MRLSAPGRPLRLQMCIRDSLCDETYQQKLMEGVARGVGDYLNSLPRK